TALIKHRVAIDLKLAASRCTGARVALAENPVAVPVPIVTAVPHHHEVPARVRRHRAAELLRRRVSIDLKLAAYRRTRARVALPENPVAVPVLIVTAGPHDHEVSA